MMVTAALLRSACVRLALMFYISDAITRDKPIDGHPVEGETELREVFLEPTMFDIEDI